MSCLVDHARATLEDAGCGGCADGECCAPVDDCSFACLPEASRLCAARRAAAAAQEAAWREPFEANEDTFARVVPAASLAAFVAALALLAAACAARRHRRKSRPTPAAHPRHTERRTSDHSSPPNPPKPSPAAPPSPTVAPYSPPEALRRISSGSPSRGILKAPLPSGHAREPLAGEDGGRGGAAAAAAPRSNGGDDDKERYLTLPKSKAKGTKGSAHGAPTVSFSPDVCVEAEEARSSSGSAVEEGTASSTVSRPSPHSDEGLLSTPATESCSFSVSLTSKEVARLYGVTKTAAKFTCYCHHFTPDKRHCALDGVPPNQANQCRGVLFANKGAAALSFFGVSALTLECKPRGSGHRKCRKKLCPFIAAGASCPHSVEHDPPGFVE
ncbi:hypothetical protein DIPPA_31790 [Diplonema papillatum]|nr:hypothetical protein DIPPA_31790 [Diplonema papillatum]